MQYNMEKKRPKLFMVLFAATTINVFVQLLLQVTNIYDLVDMVKYTEALFHIVLVISILLYAREAVVYSKKANWLMATLFTMLLAGEVAGLFMPVEVQFNDNKDYSQYAMTVFLFMFAVYYTFQVTRDYKSDAEKSAQLALAASEAKGKFLASRKGTSGRVYCMAQISQLFGESDSDAAGTKTESTDEQCDCGHSHWVL